MKVNLSRNRSLRSRAKWPTHLFEDFCLDHDMEPGDTSWRWMHSREGCHQIVDWMIKSGWKVKFWDLSPVDEEVGFGIEFDESCPRFVEFKIKQ